MSQKYVPPHLRNKTRNPPTSPIERQVANGSPAPAPAPENTSSSNWKKVVGVETEPVTKEVMIVSRKSAPAKRLYNSPIEEYSEEEDVEPPKTTDNDGWTTVEKKVKVKRDKVQEALDNGDAPLSDEDNEESFWDDQPEEYETYWDRKP